jgi:glycosyltransferase involved in cell wall biosynthesis
MPNSRRIRIGYCIDSFGIGGTELNAVRTVEALDLNRFEITIFHLHEDGPLRPRYEALGVRLVHLPISRLYAPRTAIQGLRLARILRKRGIQVVHTHDVYTNIFAVPWARMLGGCRVIASRRWLDDVPRPGLVPLNRWSYRLATRVLANSAAVARLLVEEERVPSHKVIEIPNFLEERAFQRVDMPARAAQRRQWGIPEGAFVAGVVARLAPVKNHEMLLRAAQRLDEGVHVVLVGDGTARAALEALARDLGIQARVHFIGELVSPINLHQFFDVSVLCSRSEGFPNSLIEALAAQCPVVATPVGGVTEIIVDDESGFLVQVDDLDALVCRLQSLRWDPEPRNRVAGIGLGRVRAKYHQSVVIARLASLYRELAGNASERELVLR